MTMITRAYRAAEASQIPSSRTAWKGMGRRRFCSLAVRPSPIVLQIMVLVTLASSVNSACKILKCSKEYADSTTELPDIADATTNAEYCNALRIYQDCVRGTARSCRGDLNYHSTVTLIPDLMQGHNCSSTPPNGNPQLPRPTQKPPEEVSMCSTYNGGRTFKHCGLFGDPHLRTFNDVFETCKVAGAWPLIDNRYLAVQVTNVPLVDGSSATATDQLTVIIKGHSDCSEQKLYQAQTGNLPASFVDGTRESGPGRSLTIAEIVTGKHVEIHAKFIATTIVVRQVGHYLTFAIRMPSDLVDTGVKDGLELCVKGCPHQEKIELLSSPNQIKDTSGLVMSKETAIAKCLEANVTDFYFDSCVFDLITTGDVNFTMAAKKALKDYQELLPNANVHHNRTSEWISPSEKSNTLEEEGYSGAPARTTNSWTLGVCVLLVLLTRGGFLTVA